jgi:hypothetical protein
MGNYDYKYLLCEAQVLGNAADEYTDDDINFGMAGPGVNMGGQFGLHMVVTTTFTGLDSGAIIWTVHSASATPTTKHTGMYIPVASLVAGAHFFVPCGNIKLLQYARGLFDIISEVATAGAATMWFGDASDWTV